MQYQLQGTNTYIVGTGKARLLIDTGQGIPIWGERLTKVLHEEGIELSHVLLTHWHGDHTGGLPYIHENYPQLSSHIYKNKPDAGQTPLYEDQVIKVEGATIRCVLCPGHSTDHMCFVLEEESALFTGDNVLGHGFTVHEDLPAYMTSLQTMANQKCQIGYPAHGVVITNLPAKLREYTGQRVQREKQILRALEKAKLAGGGRLSTLTAEEVVSLIHGGVSDQVIRVMEPLVVEVLWKLAGEKRVAFLIDGMGTRKWFARLNAS